MDLLCHVASPFRTCPREILFRWEKIGSDERSFIFSKLLSQCPARSLYMGPELTTVKMERPREAILWDH